MGLLHLTCDLNIGLIPCAPRQVGAVECHLGVRWRARLAEVRRLIYPESPHAAPTDPALWGNKLPSEIDRDRNGSDLYGKRAATYDKSLAELDKQFEASPSSRDDRGREPDLDKE